MSSRSEAHQVLTDDELLAVIRDVDETRAINGLPDARTIAEHCAISRSSVSKRIHRLETYGRLEVYESVVAGRGGGGVVKTVELPEGDR